jgi:hypothetical protein
VTIDEWDVWVRVFRDALIVAVGTFMLVFETAFADHPNAYIIAAGLAALGLPPALRLDLRTAGERRAQRRRSPDPNEPEPEEDDRWSHLP